MDLLLAVPFCGLLLSIALGPLLCPTWWEHRYERVTLFWTVSLISLLYATQGWAKTLHGLEGILMSHYVPFVCLIGSLFVVSGGIHISIRARGRPLVNVLYLAIAGLFANLIGTTGAAMVFIRPLIRMNAYRRYKTHVIVFFIFVVCNLSGCLTPIGDPPLFLGFLEGVSITWPARYLSGPFLGVVLPTLGVFYCIDKVLFHSDHQDQPAPIDELTHKIHLTGARNIPWFLLIISIVIISGLWADAGHTDGFDVGNLLRDLAFVAIGAACYLTTPRAIYESNHFSFDPLREVAVLFFGLFVTVSPVLGILHTLHTGPFAFIAEYLYTNTGPSPQGFYWVTGILSMFLDNAPTYLVFFHAAGGKATQLMGEWSQVLVAISSASVFFGAMTYIGNAPNFMVKAVAERSHIPMPSFFGYMLWSVLVLGPIFYALHVWQWG